MISGKPHALMGETCEPKFHWIRVPTGIDGDGLHVVNAKYQADVVGVVIVVQTPPISFLPSGTLCLFGQMLHTREKL
jgi:hypothetical protein